MKTKDNSTAGLTAALNRLVLEQAILSYALDFTSRGVVVTARIQAQDELSAARAKRRIHQALNPVFRTATVIIQQVPAPQALK